MSRLRNVRHDQRIDLQDCYINHGEAHGLCFSVMSESAKCPPSLRNVFKELERDYGIKRTTTDLTDWADQGVLLINKALTVRQGSSLSHMKIWKPFTDEILKHITSSYTNIVYILWGNTAKEILPNIDESNNLVLCSVHPSPLAQGRGNSFVGNGHFTACNAYLEKVGKGNIVWV